jgi:hypothetical protein
MVFLRKPRLASGASTESCCHAEVAASFRPLRLMGVFAAIDRVRSEA